MRATSVDFPAPVAPTTRVLHVYPSSDVLPENELKFYLSFSAPMQQGEAWTRIHLLDAAGKRPLAADSLALARRERRQEVLENGIAGVFPVELLVRALEEPVRPEQAPFGLGQEGQVDRGSVAQPAQLDQAGCEPRLNRL